MLAHEERNSWWEKLRKEELPPELEEYILWYMNNRDDETWRSSRLVEALGEVVLYWYEERSKKND